MSEVKLISPMLDDFIVGNAISEHNGVRCYPAMKNDSDARYILKVISIPASSVQLDALLLTGAYQTREEASAYFAQLAKDVENELGVLNRLAKLEGFFTYEACQIEPSEETSGYDVYLLGRYKKSLERHFRKLPMTHLAAVNLGLDICASLTVCRQAGYLYTDLKPGNIFITEDNEYRIGDLGFLPIIGLKYASLPDRYRSSYTAPELLDPFAPISPSMDIYAAGLILYQAYNGGVLPFEGDAPAEPLPAPLYADYEMSEIILKACAPDPADRWDDPIKMGQALVGYMQRNSVNDTPIVPPPAMIDEPEEIEPESFEEEPEQEDEVLYEQADEAGQMMIEQMLDEEQPQEDIPEEEDVLEEEPDEDEDLANLSFLDEMDVDETVPQEETAEEIVYEELTEDVCDILEQADDLIAHEPPAPVVAPEPIDIPMPEPIEPEPEEEETPDHVEDTVAAITEALAAEDETIRPVSNVTLEEEESEEEPQDEPEEEEDPYAPFEEEKPAKKSWGNRILAGLLVVIILACLAVAGFLFYRDYYIKIIDDIKVTGVDNKLTVSVSTKADHNLLNVVCTDTYGNRFPAPVENGFATFTELTPDTLYTITVEIEGFHGVKGKTRTTYTTAPQTEIVSLQAVTGAEPGTVILNFTTKGYDYDQWTITYSSTDEAAKSQSFSGHMTSVSGLTVGKTYTFSLDAEGNGFVTGQTQLEYTATELVYPTNVDVTTFTEDALTVVWNDPIDMDVTQWTVLCYNDTGYNQNVTTSENTAQFSGIDTTAAYNIEVTAAGMSVGTRFYISKNAVTITSIAVTPNRGGLDVSWQFNGAETPSEWILSYIPEGSTVESAVATNGTYGRIEGVVPGAVYTIRLQLKDGTTVIAGTQTVTVPEAQPFNDYGATAEGMVWQMCLRPEDPAWVWWAVANFQESFTADQKAGFVARLTNRYAVSGDPITIVYAVRDAEGKLVSAHVATEAWSNMWYQFYGEFDVPALPQTPGQYTLDIYFNGASAHHQEFTITG